VVGEVVSDAADSVHATFSRKKREEMRALGRLQNNMLRGALGESAPTPAGGAPAVGKKGKRAKGDKGATGSMMPVTPARDEELGQYVGMVRRAREDREEIGRLLNTIPSAERGRIPDVASTAVELVNRIEAMAVDVAQSDRAFGPDRAKGIESEIATLEAEANPLDTSKSETRVRRLAQLRRDRRAVAEFEQKRTTRLAQMESCRLALENVRLDLVRLRTGNSSVQSVTLIAEQAMALAREVDIAVGAAGEVREASRGRAASPA